MPKAIPYEGEKDGYRYSYLSTTHNDFHDYTLTNPDGNTIRLHGLKLPEAFQMSQDPKKYYDDMMKQMSEAKDPACRG